MNNSGSTSNNVNEILSGGTGTILVLVFLSMFGILAALTVFARRRQRRNVSHNNSEIVDDSQYFHNGRGQSSEQFCDDGDDNYVMTEIDLT